jgi:hypothetical protein
MLVVTFGDSILDCGRYNEHGVTPGQLLVRNDDGLFPEFRGRDLAPRGAARLEHRAVDGSTVEALPAQARGLAVTEPAAALVTIGGNDLLAGLIVDSGPGIDAFAGALVDLHAHFLTGDPSWFAYTIEPSLRGASEARRCFLPYLLPASGE